MSGAQFPFSSAPLRAVKEVQFGLLSPEEIVSSCCVQDQAKTPHPKSELWLKNRSWSIRD